MYIGLQYVGRCLCQPTFIYGQNITLSKYIRVWMVYKQNGNPSPAPGPDVLHTHTCSRLVGLQYKVVVVYTMSPALSHHDHMHWVQ